MPAGNLRDRVGFYRPVRIDAPGDGYGNETSGFGDTPDFQRSARIVPRLGGEMVLANRLTGKNAVNITVRYSAEVAEVDENWKVRDERAGVDYNIRSIIDPEQGTSDHGLWLELLCERGVAQ